ncbi:MAG: hypothetical protein ACXVHT_09725 [Methanobacterium sp.]
MSLENNKEKTVTDLEEELEKSRAEFEEAKKIFKKYLKTLYDNVGMEWTDENDLEIEFLVNSIAKLAVIKAQENAGKLLIEVFTPKNEK